MKRNKKTTEGLAERKKVLSRHFLQLESFVNAVFVRFRRRQVAEDDVLDALVAAVTASSGPDRLLTIPEEPEMDEKDLRMEMVYAKNE